MWLRRLAARPQGAAGRRAERGVSAGNGDWGNCGGRGRGGCSCCSGARSRSAGCCGRCYRSVSRPCSADLVEGGQVTEAESAAVKVVAWFELGALANPAAELEDLLVDLRRMQEREELGLAAVGRRVERLGSSGVFVAGRASRRRSSKLARPARGATAGEV